MKKALTLLAVISAILFAPCAASAQSASDILSKLGTVANNVLGSGKVTIADLEGTWSYVEPAVEFKSDNLLKKAGGSVASTTIVNKLKPYYQKVGMDKMTLSVDSAATFKMSVGKIPLTGQIVASETDGQFVFQFKAANKINMGKVNAYVSKTATGQIKLTFDVSKLISLVETVAKISGNSSMKTVSSMLTSYDGLTAGFVLKKSK
ncbi:MAG: DUF4923 family protein [Muribaculaceae bacterium]|nr:DUF4923 family protein [Muribaculaceae bacterium]